MLELKLIHDGEFWIAEDGDIRAKAKTLKDLDREIGELLKERERGSPKNQLKVLMTFDNSVIPQWIRQYSGHYFNRVVTINF